jgi:ribonuclease HII
VAVEIIGGLDEVGWGALAGPVISCVAVFREQDLALMPPGVKDSKKCSPEQRSMLYLPLCSVAYDVGIGHAWPWEMDRMGAFKALQLSYKRALEEIHPSRQPNLLIVDGSNKVHAWKGKQRVEPKADVRFRQVSAASIIAKVFRDTIMCDYAKKFPLYHFEINKGYGTPDHQAAILQHGILDDEKDLSLYIHRRFYCRRWTQGKK